MFTPVFQFIHTDDCAEALITLMEHYDEADFVSDITTGVSVTGSSENTRARRRTDKFSLLLSFFSFSRWVPLREVAALITKYYEVCTSTRKTV